MSFFVSLRLRPPSRRCLLDLSRRHFERWLRCKRPGDPSAVHTEEGNQAADSSKARAEPEGDREAVVEPVYHRARRMAACADESRRR